MSITAINDDSPVFLFLVKSKKSMEMLFRNHEEQG